MHFQKASFQPLVSAFLTVVATTIFVCFNLAMVLAAFFHDSKMCDSSVDRTDYEHIPTLYDVVTVSSSCFRRYVSDLQASRYQFPSSLIRDVKKHCNFSLVEILLFITVAACLTLLRKVATKYIFEPWGRSYGLRPASLAKMPESAFKFTYHFVVWSFNFYIIFNQKVNLFFEPYKVWDDWAPNVAVPGDVYVFYVVECGHYLHALFATVFLDVKRKDFKIMVFHHVVAFMLVFFSLSARYHQIGILVTFFHDFSDIMLELTKVNIYFEKRRGGKSTFNQYSSMLSFAALLISWLVMRLYWFPQRVLWIAGVLGVLDGDKPFGGFLFLLWIVMALNLFWFYLITRVALRMIWTNTVEDIREDDEDTMQLRDKLSKNGDLTHQPNGIKHEDQNQLISAAISADDSNNSTVARKRVVDNSTSINKSLVGNNNHSN